MRGTLEDNNALDLRLFTGKMATAKRTLTGNYSVPTRAHVVELLDPGGINRDVTLPALESDRMVWIVHAGTANTLAVKSPGGATLVTLSANQGMLFVCDGVEWHQLGVAAGGGGGITDAYGTITDGTTPASAVGTDTFKIRAGGLVSAVTGNDDVTHGDNVLLSLADIAATSVVGRSAGTSGAPAAISASADGQVLRRAGGVLAFGAVDLTDADAISGALGISNGGTGQTAAVAAFDALSPLTTKGDVLSNNGTNDIRLAVGTNGFVLKADSVEVSGLVWAAANAHSHIAADITDFQEAVEDRIGSGFVIGGTDIAVTYNDVANTFTVDFDGVYAPPGAEYLVGVANATLTAERVVTNTATVSWDLATAGQAKSNVVDASVTNAKLADMAAWSIKARDGATAGVATDEVASTLTEDTTPVTGDKLLGWISTGELRTFDVGNLPSGGGAPVGATYVVISLDGTLTSERNLVGGGGLTLTDGGANGAVTLAVGAGTGITVNLDDVAVATNGVTFALMQDIATDRLIGRDTAATGDPEEIALNATLEFTGAGAVQRAALTGDVTAAAGSNATTTVKATTSEVLTGTDAAKVVTSDALASLWEKGVDEASAAVVSFGEGGFFHVTGTTTITDIDWDVATNGRRVWVVFDGVLTLTHNGTTLQLPSAANIVTAAGDRALFVQDAADNAICLSYVRADGTAVVGGGGGGAPTGAQYVVMALDGTLTSERVLTAGSGVRRDDGGANGNVTLTVRGRTAAMLAGGSLQ